MFQLTVCGAGGVEAEFSVPSATLALDLTLRSQRAGCLWRLEHHAGGTVRTLTLDQLRTIAVANAQQVEELALIDEIEWQHELQSAFELN